MKLLPVKKYVKYTRYDGVIIIIDTKVDDNRPFGSQYFKDEDDSLYWGRRNFGEIDEYIQQGKIIEESEKVGE